MSPDIGKNADIGIGNNPDEHPSGTLATFDIEGQTFDIGILRYCIGIERQKMTFDIEIRYYTRYQMF